jgi:hypothetical protein
MNGRSGIRAHSSDGTKSYLLIKLGKREDAHVIVYTLNEETGASSLYSQETVPDADINDCFQLGEQLYT